MRRRTILAALSGALLLPVAARAQHSGKLPTIGVFGAGTPSAWAQWTGGLSLPLRAGHAPGPSHG